jgi:hypothetical protein
MYLFSLPLSAAMNIGSRGLPDIVGLWFVVVWGATAIVHIAFAWAVLVDADLIWRMERRKPFLVGAGLWGLATLLGGVLVAALYWLIHHSTMRSPTPPPTEPPRGHLPPRPSNPNMDSVK